MAVLLGSIDKKIETANINPPPPERGTDLKEGAILFAEFCGEGDVVALVLLDEVAEEGLLAPPHLVAPPVGLHHRLDLLAQPVHAPLLEHHAVADRALMDDDIFARIS